MLMGLGMKQFGNLLENIRYLRIMGFDPGSSFLGVSLLESDDLRAKISYCDAFTLTTDKQYYYSSADRSDRQNRLRSIEYYLCGHIRDMRPHVVVYETAFNNPSRPGAYGPLVETISMITRSVDAYSLHIPVFGIAPMEVKKAFGVAGKAKGEDAKSLVYDKVKALKLPFNCYTYFDELDQHSVDAIAVAYTFWLSRKEI